MKRNFGLKETPKDNRDFLLGSIFRLPKLEELPNEFIFDIQKIEDQLDSDFCSAFSSSYLSELQEDVDLEPSLSFAISKVISGDPAEWGQDIRSAMKSHVDF